MGQFTQRVSRKGSQPAKTFTIPEELLSLEWSRGRRQRQFTIRQLFGDEATGTDDMILRSVARVGGRQVTGEGLREWWRDIGPKSRAGVRLCFYAVHQPSE